MDPDKALKTLGNPTREQFFSSEFYASLRTREQREAFEGLWRWLQRGGFEPRSWG